MTSTGHSIDINAELDATFEKVAALPPEEKAKVAHQMWTQLLTVQARVARLRTSAVRELRAEGHTLRQLAREMDLSVTRIRQIEDYDPAPGKEAVAGE